MTNTEIIHIREVPLSQFTRQAKMLRELSGQADDFKERMSEISSYEEELNLTEIAVIGYQLAAFLESPTPADRLRTLIDHLSSELAYYPKRIQEHTDYAEAKS